MSLLLAACGVDPTSQTDLIEKTALATTQFTDLTAQPRTVLIDTDMAYDDWMAILFLLNIPEMDIGAITVTGAGEAHCEPGMRHAVELVEISGGDEIPVACGRETPLRGDHTFPASWRRGVDSYRGFTSTESMDSFSNQSAVELLISIIQSSSHKVSLLTLGPLTNVAEAIQDSPGLVENLEMIYIMGGAVDVPGNIAPSDVEIENEAAEWNLYIDPYAAKIVLESGAPITLVSLDATNHAPVTLSFYKRLEDDHTSPEATFIFDLLTGMYGFIKSGGYYFWDPLAAAIMADESLATLQTRWIIVIDEEGPESGRTKPVDDGFEVLVAVSADGPRFEGVFLNTINDQSH